MHLTSQRLYYRKYTTADEHLYVQMSTDDELMKFITGKALTQEEAKERFKKILAINEDETESAAHAVFMKDTDEYVGFSKFVFTKKGQVEIGYLVMERFWGQKIGTEISKRMVSLSDEVKGVKELIGIIDPENQASKRILEKCGFTFKENGTYKGLPSATYHMLLK